jgi:quinolinate synthase
MGIFYELMQKNPDKKFYSVGHRQFCPNMKKVSLNNVMTSLETLDNPVELDEELRVKANLPLKRMLELAAQ